MHALQQMPTAQPGFMSRRVVVDAYVKATGFDVSDFRFLRVLAMSKTAAIMQQLHLRFRSGATSETGRAHVCTPVPIAQPLCRPRPDKTMSSSQVRTSQRA